MDVLGRKVFKYHSRVMELHVQLQALIKYGLSISAYLMHVKTISDHLATSDKIIHEKDVVLYVFNGLGPRYLTFVTSFNMTQTRPSISILYSLLENYERMLATSNKSDQDLAF